MILSCQNVTKAFGEDVLFSDVSFQINEGEKFAIVGSNGTGKSTLLKTIVGELSPDDGNVVFAKDASFGYLAQYQNDEEEGTIYEIVLSARKELLKLESNLREMEGKMSQVSATGLDSLMNDYHRRQEEFERLGGNTYRSEVTGVLKGLGFSEDDFGKQMTELSGGQKTRVSLGKLLATKPDILILDEPINHLDLHSIEWLESFLLNYSGSVIIVAHDRFFLDRIVDHVIDLSSNKAYVYKGNYSSFVEQKDIRMISMLREYEKQQKEIKHQEEVIEKLRSYNREKSIKRAESRVKLLNKMERLENPEEWKKQMTLNLEPNIRSGNDVLSVDSISKAYDGNTVLKNLSFDINRMERVAIIGDNGTGKTTILKILNRIVEADSGLFTIGANVEIGYYDQEQQELSDEKTLFEEMSDAYPDLDNTKIRNVLAAFLFTGEDVFKKISMLSGGERGRLSLAKLMLSGANFLILDEPTNHLDMESKEVLENALNSYNGTILFVSHDRYFINKVATRILDLKEYGFNEYKGNYDYYLEKKELIEGLALKNREKVVSSTEKNTDSDSSKLSWEEQKRISAEKRKKENELAKIEEKIALLEEKIAKIDEEFLDASNQTNSAKLNELTKQQNEYKDELEVLYEKWDEAVAEM